ncbi:MAG: mitofilin family membrane protein, partial [Zavarzinia sp.]|nr:mitofilin family membrane protein [Zavarzinia sp.]
PPPARGSRRSLWFGIAAIVLVAAGAGIWYRYGDRLTAVIDGGQGTVAAPVAGSVAEDSRIAALEAAVAGLDRKIQALDARVAEIGEAPGTGGAVDDGTVAELRDQIDALRERQGALEEALAAAESGTDDAGAEDAAEGTPAPAAPSSGGLMADAALSARLAAIEARLATPSSDAAAIAALQQEIAALKAAAASADTRITNETERLRDVGRGVSLVYAIGRLRNLLGTDAPYAAALKTVRGHFDALGLLREPTIGKALDTLEVHAVTGLATRATLATEFVPLARAAVQAANVPADADVVDKLLAEAGNLITIRPVGEVEGDDAAARVARAERRLDRGDLAGAVAEIAPLEGGAATVLADWRARAEARLAAEAAVDLLDGEVSARFAEAH